MQSFLTHIHTLSWCVPVLWISSRVTFVLSAIVVDPDFSWCWSYWQPREGSRQLPVPWAHGGPLRAVLALQADCPKPECFETLSAMELAEQITLLDHVVFRSIPYEWASCTWAGLGQLPALCQASGSSQQPYGGGQHPQTHSCSQVLS